MSLFLNKTFYFLLYNLRLMMFHPKQAFIKRYELQKHRMVHESDILLRAATKPSYFII